MILPGVDHNIAESMLGYWTAVSAWLDSLDFR